MLPWFLMYGLSSIPFAHAPYFDARDAARKLPLWTMTMDRTVDLPVPEADDQLMRAFGARAMQEAGLEGTSFGVYRQSPNQLNVYAYSFLKSTQLKYVVDTQAADRRGPAIPVGPLPDRHARARRLRGRTAVSCARGAPSSISSARR